MKLIKILAVTSVLALCSSAFAFEATVKKVTGRVEIKDGASWIQVEEGDVLDEGTVISTGYKSSVTVSVKNSTFELGPLARLTLEELLSSDDKDSVQLYLDSGTISAKVSNEEGKTVGFKTRSPVATASVRGTEFTYSANGSLSCIEGLTALGPAEPRDRRGTDTVKPGKSSVFTSTKDVGSARATPVYAGQVSSVDSFTGERSAPQTQIAKESSPSTLGTSSAASLEGEAAVAASYTPDYDTVVASETADIIITLLIED